MVEKAATHKPLLDVVLPNTLGYHRAMCVALVGDNNRAVEFLDEKIAASAAGASEPVIADESQMVGLLIPMMLQPRHVKLENPGDNLDA